MPLGRASEWDMAANSTMPSRHQEMRGDGRGRLFNAVLG